MEQRCFRVKLFGRPRARPPGDAGPLVTNLHWLRLFHPEGNAFVQASGDPDKVLSGRGGR